MGNDVSFKHRVFRLLLGTTLLATAACGGTDEQPAPQPEKVLQLSFEAVPGNGFDVGGHVYDTGMTGYADKAVFTAEVLAEVVPGVLDAVGVKPEDLKEQLTPGGFQLATSPSLQIRGSFDAAGANELAAALGYTAYQWSVLAADFSAESGGTGYGAIRFEAGPPTPEVAQAFFEHAASVSPGLGGGYTAFDDELIFINLADEQGQPFSGLADEAFTSALEEAAGSFMDAEVTLSKSGEVEAWLVDNDWTGKAPAGEDYAAILDDAEESALDEERKVYLGILEEAAKKYGW